MLYHDLILVCAHHNMLLPVFLVPAPQHKNGVVFPGDKGIVRQFNGTVGTDNTVSLLQRRDETGLKSRQSAAGKTQRSNRMHINTAGMKNGLGLYLQRFGLKKPARRADTVTSNIQQCASAGFRFQARIFPLVPVLFSHAVAKGRSDKTGRADAAFGNHLFDAPAAGVKAIHKGFHQQAAGILCSASHLLGLFCAARQRFFAQHVFAGVKRLYCPGMMKMIGKRKINDLDFRIFQQGIVTVIDPFDVIVPNYLFSPRR